MAVFVVYRSLPVARGTYMGQEIGGGHVVTKRLQGPIIKRRPAVLVDKGRVRATPLSIPARKPRTRQLKQVVVLRIEGLVDQRIGRLCYEFIQPNAGAQVSENATHARMLKRPSRTVNLGDAATPLGRDTRQR